MRAGSSLTVFDGGAVIRAPGMCGGSGSQLVTCTFDQPVARVHVRGDDGDDRLDAVALTDGTPATLDGGSGDDVLVGGPFEDTLTGGSDDDTLDGRGGSDVASFTDRRAGARVDLHAGTATRPGGEHDSLVNVADVRGGGGDDVLIGDRHANALTGGGGNDDLRGRGGADYLAGEGLLHGGAGNDRLRLLDHGRATCGEGGNDLATASREDSIVDDSCEALRLPGLTVALHLAHRDPARDFIAIPVLGLRVGDTIAARLTVRATLTVIGSLQHRNACESRCPHPRLRFSPAGATHVRRGAPLNIVFSVRAHGARTYGGTVRLRINPH